MKVGILLNYNTSEDIGGGHSYYTRMTKKLINYNFDSEIVVVCFNKHQVFENVDLIKVYEFSYPLIYYFFKVLLFIFGASGFTKNHLYNKLYFYKEQIEIKLHEKKFKQSGIHILYYITPSINKYNFPYIATCWDLGHKTSFAFPEFTMNGAYSNRDKFAQKVYQKAFAIMCESEAGKNDLVFYERINPQRIYVLPMIEGPVVDIFVEYQNQIEILRKYNLNDSKYFYYPAQFWAHKNHINLLKAFKRITNNNKSLKLVLTGSDKGNLNYIKEFISINNLENQVIICGFVELEEVFTFYKNSTALVYPSYLGPTNMPLVEAKKLGVNVICSNLPGHVEQLRDYATYFDPSNYEDIYIKLCEFLNSDKSTLKINDEVDTCTLLNKHLLEIKKNRESFTNNFNQY